jgi:hypothetical protein
VNHNHHVHRPGDTISIDLPGEPPLLLTPGQVLDLHRGTQDGVRMVRPETRVRISMDKPRGTRCLECTGAEILALYDRARNEAERLDACRRLIAAWDGSVLTPPQERQAHLAQFLEALRLATEGGGP